MKAKTFEFFFWSITAACVVVFFSVLGFWIFLGVSVMDAGPEGLGKMVGEFLQGVEQGKE